MALSLNSGSSSSALVEDASWNGFLVGHEISEHELEAFLLFQLGAHGSDGLVGVEATGVGTFALSVVW